VVVKLILRLEPLHVLAVRGKVLRFTLFNKFHPILFCQIFVLTEGGVLVPLNLHKLTLVAPPSMRDDLQCYLLSLPLQLFQILVLPNLHKLTLVAPLSMRDDLQCYLLSLPLQLFQILNICLNRVFEEFILFTFGQVIKSL
jgi:hypothetical protein